MVTVFNDERDQRETVYTDADGSYAIRTAYAGKLDVRARLANYDDSRMQRVESRRDRPRSTWRCKRFARSAGRVRCAVGVRAQREAAVDGRAPTGRVRQPVQLLPPDRQLHDARAAQPRGLAARPSRKMEGMLAMLTRRRKEAVADVLSRGFDGKPVEAVQNYGATRRTGARQGRGMAGRRRAVVHPRHSTWREDEQALRHRRGPRHDLGARPRHRQDRGAIALPDIDLPRGGKFSGMQLPIGIFTGKHGPHSMAQTQRRPHLDHQRAVEHAACRSTR